MATTTTTAPASRSTRGTTSPTPLRPLKAIRAKCLDCCGDIPSEVRNCPVTDCTLYPYRLGKRPTTK